MVFIRETSRKRAITRLFFRKKNAGFHAPIVTKQSRPFIPMLWRM